MAVSPGFRSPRSMSGPHGRPPLSAIRLWAAPAILAALSGCGLVDVEDARIEAGKVARELAEVRPEPSGPRYSTVRTVEHPYVGLEPVAEDPRRDLPERFLTKDAVTLPLAGAARAAALAARIEAATGLKVQFTGSPVPAGDGGGSPAPETFGAAWADGLSPNGGIWTGPLDRLLNAWTQAAGYDWRYDAEDEAIEIVRSASAVFRVHALAGEQRHIASSSTRGREGEDGAANLTSQSIATETTYRPWPEIEDQLEALVGPGTRVAVAPSSASVMVTGSPRDVGRVRNFLGYLNREVLRPVTLSVHVYSVRFEREAGYDLGLSFAVSKLFGSSLGLAVSGGTVAVVKPDVAKGDTLSAAVEALSRAGTVSRVLSADVPSLNGKPAQFFELVSEAYLKELRTTAGDGLAETQLVPGTVSSGFALSYLPRITGPDEVLVRLSASLRDRPTFTVFASDGRTIQLPAYASRAVQVTQKIGRGETLMVTGFSDRSASSERGGTFAVDLPLPEGHRRADLVRAEQVLLIGAEIGPPLGISETRGAEL